MKHWVIADSMYWYTHQQQEKREMQLMKLKRMHSGATKIILQIKTNEVLF